jgi:tRNA threonylcarbamoyladenosine biosynthesis protein TsaE
MMETNQIIQNSKLKIKHSTVFSTVSRSSLQTRNLGKRLGKLLKGGEIIGLTGELGSGKTCFVRGVTEGLDVGEGAWIRSPTFTLINEYHGRLPVYHIDLYRVGSPRDMQELDLVEYLFSDGVSLIEWFDHLPSGEAEEYLNVKFEHVDGNQRKLTFVSFGGRYDEIIEILSDRFQNRKSGIQNPKA